MPLLNPTAIHVQSGLVPALTLPNDIRGKHIIEVIHSLNKLFNKWLNYFFLNIIFLSY